MSKKTIYLLGILLTILIGMYFYWKICCQLDKSKECCTKKELVETPKLERNGFRISSDAGNGLDVDVNSNYNFDVSGSGILQPISADLTASLGKVKAFLDANPDQQLNVVGHYKSSETNNTAFPDLGLARANEIKNHLVSQGVSAKSIVTSSNLNDDFAVENDTLFGPVAFDISGVNNQTDWTAMGENIKANPLVLYFNTAQADINLTQEQREKVADLINYLDHVEGASAIATGHTDSEGSEATNVPLGKKRAQFAVDYLVKIGLNPNQIEATSKGSSEPVADNATEEGRAKNRRTVVTLK